MSMHIQMFYTSRMLIAVVAIAISTAVHAEEPQSADLHALASAPLRFDPVVAVPLATYAAQEARVPFGQAGSWRWMLHLGGGTNLDDSTFGQAGIVISHFVEQDLSVNLELNGLFLDQPGENAIAGNLNLLFQWHFLRNEERTWSVYADGGAGLFYATEDVPVGATRFNFVPQLGMGVSYNLDNYARLHAGFRWHHISNANTSSNNPGRDSLLLYTGVSFPF